MLRKVWIFGFRGPQGTMCYSAHFGLMINLIFLQNVPFYMQDIHTVSELKYKCILNTLILRKSITYQMFLGKFRFRIRVEHTTFITLFRRNSLKTVEFLWIFLRDQPFGLDCFAWPIQPFFKSHIKKSTTFEQSMATRCHHLILSQFNLICRFYLLFKH